MKLSTKILATLAFAPLWSTAAFASTDCGTITIASMNWQSAEFMANVDQVILAEGYGCDAQLVSGDTVPTVTSMVEKGEPDVAPQIVVSALPELIKRGTSENRIVSLGQSLPDGTLQGFWMPKYIADAHPDIKTVGDALKHPELFPAPEDQSKGAVYNGPQGWIGTVLTSQFFKALKGKDSNFVLVDTGSAAGLDGSIANAYEKKQGWLGFYWEPSSILGRYQMVRLEMGASFDAAEWARCSSIDNCPDPKLNDWPADDTQTIISASFAKKGNAALEYLQKRKYSNTELNKVLLWMTENQATGVEGANYFLKNNPQIWTPWVPKDVSDRIKKSL